MSELVDCFVCSCVMPYSHMKLDRFVALASGV